MKDVVLIVGNGLTISYCKSSLFTNPPWDTQRPLAWELKSHENVNLPIWVDFPRLQRIYPWFYDRLESSSFPIIQDILLNVYARYPNEYEQDFWKAELRHYLCRAFIAFHQKFVTKVNFAQWESVIWLQKYADRIGTAISFNYDLILEKLFSSASIPFYRVGLEYVERHSGVRPVPILKPHGSIDFFIDHFIGFDQIYPLDQNVSSIENISDYFGKIEEDKFDKRISAEIVLPNEYNYQIRWPHVGRGNFLYGLNKIFARNVVVVGLSYSIADRNELDEYLLRLDQNVNVYLVNPVHSPEWVSKLEKHFGPKLNLRTSLSEVCL